MSLIVMKTRSNFSAVFPPCIVFGTGVINQVGEQAKNLGISKVLIVTDKGVVEYIPGFKDMLNSLKEAGIGTAVWSEVVPDPPDTIVPKGVKFYQDENCDGIIAMGGGSSIDLGKSIGVVATNGKRINDYGSLSPSPLPIKTMPPLITVPTTAGTGSEVTPFAVITDTTKNFKFFLFNPMLFAKVAIVDPNLYLSLPPMQTMSTGFDAFAHAVEAYINVNESPMADSDALYAVELVSQNLRRAVYNGPNDVEARANMAIASMKGGMAMNNSLTCFGHALGHNLACKYHIPHGISCVISYPEGLQLIKRVKPEKMAKLAQAMGADISGLSAEEASDAFIFEVKRLMRDTGCPTLTQLTKGQMKESDIVEIAKISEGDAQNTFTPIKFTADTYADMMRKMLADG